MIVYDLCVAQWTRLQFQVDKIPTKNILNNSGTDKILL